MANGPMRILLTGAAGCGKTTAVTKIVAAREGKLKLTGFYTEEMREAGWRTRSRRGRSERFFPLVLPAV
jgi:nucleoside-triphosphatase THEP1